MRLNRLYDAYAKKGLRLIVISPHGAAELRKELIETHKAKYWIACDSTLRTTIGYVVPNVPAVFPMTYLVSGRGAIVDHGAKLEATIESLLQEVFEPALGRSLHKVLASAQKSYDAGAVGAAWKAAGAKLEHEDAAVVADATFLRKRAEAYGAFKQRMLQREIDAGAYPESVAALKVLEKDFRGMPTASWANETRRTLEKDPKVRVELKVWAQFEKLLVKAEKAEGDPKKTRSVNKAFNALARKYPGTRAAAEAERRLLR